MGEAMKSELRDRLRANASVAKATDAKIAELAEAITAAHVAFEQVVSRVEALEGVAGALTNRVEQSEAERAAAPQATDGNEAAATDGAATDGAATDGAKHKGPKREPRDTPDLR
jgi:hypothetical protein